jgi:hypothetical protein
MANCQTRTLSCRLASVYFPIYDTFRPHPVTRSHDHEFSVRRNHHSVVDDARWHVDFADHRRLPDIGLV